MPTTSGGLRYPASSDAVNVPGHLQNLADDVDTTKAPKESPALTGTPTAPTAAADTNTTQVATTAYVIGQAGSTTPTTLGTAAVGTSNRYARADHRHAMPSASDVGAISNALVQAKADLVTATGNATPARLGVGANDTLLVAASGEATGLKWANLTASQIPTLSSAKVPTLDTNAQTDSYTLVLGDAGKTVLMGKATAQTLTIPLNSSVAFPTGTKIDVIQTGAGETTIAATSGVTLNSEGSKKKINAQWQAVSMVKTASDTWVLIGAIKA